MYYNCDCITGSQKHIKDNSIDLIITDPPYGISGDTLHKHYNRNENNVLDGYIEVPEKEYPAFSDAWIAQAERILKPGGSMYVVSGYTNLIHILNALDKTKLKEINHIIWKFNFGVYTKNKYISSHYHILYYSKPGKKTTFNTYAYYSDSEKDENGGSLNYKDREDVWIINREYKPGEIKNKNELPTALLKRMILYSSNPDDMVFDFFLGSFSTAKVALGLGRKASGFEKSEIAFNYQIKQMEKINSGELLSTLRTPPKNRLYNSGKPLSDEEKADIIKKFNVLIRTGSNKKQSIEKISQETGRGYWSILKMVDGTTNKSVKDESDSLFPSN